jgi:hypothetical protein
MGVSQIAAVSKVKTPNPWFLLVITLTPFLGFWTAVESLLIVILAFFNHKYIYSLLAKRRGSSTTRRKVRRRNTRSPFCRNCYHRLICCERPNFFHLDLDLPQERKWLFPFIVAMETASLLFVLGLRSGWLVAGAKLEEKEYLHTWAAQGNWYLGLALGKAEWRVTHLDFLITKLERAIKVLSRPGILKYHIYISCLHCK